MIPDMIKHSRRQSSCYCNAASKASELAILPDTVPLLDRFKEKYAKKHQKQKQTENPQLTKNLQKDLMGMNHGFGPLERVRKIVP